MNPDQAGSDPVAVKPGQNQILTGIGWMVASAMCFVAVGTLVRWVGKDLPAAEGAFIRYAIGLLFVFPTLMRFFRGTQKIDRQRIFWLRGFVHVFAVMLWFYAMQRLTIAEVTALGYTAPLWVVIGAALFLGEVIKIRRLIALGLGITGALIILRPGFQTPGAGQIAQLLAAPLFALSSIQGKFLTGHHSSKVIVTMLTLTCTVFLAPFALWNWVTPGLNDVLLLALTAVAATLGHFTMTAAFRAAPITVTQPVNVLQLVFATIVGVLLFSDPLDPYVLAGGTLTVTAVSYITYREHRLEKQGRT